MSWHSEDPDATPESSLLTSTSREKEVDNPTNGVPAHLRGCNKTGAWRLLLESPGQGP